MSDSVRPHRRNPTRLPHPWDTPGKNSGVGCHFLLQCRKVKSESESLSRVRLFSTAWTATYQAPPSMGFSRQEYWSGVPSPSPKPRLVTLKSEWFDPSATSRCLETFLVIVQGTVALHCPLDAKDAAKHPIRHKVHTPLPSTEDDLA